ncbi:thiamine pyrophosphate-binding protein [Pigmentiphaga soli]|uniref:Thiamine pyrophosphate-binding protein n=1 Tax=Pigmentiphaga soli TaxID=1007095 RepID=A0ABP8HMJ6_9BURK
MLVSGNTLAVEALRRHGVDTFFFLMGGPMLALEKGAIDAGLRGIDVRHEQAAAMMAHAYARVTNRVGVCMACSGPGTINLGTGMANALVDCAPVVALGGSSPLNEAGTGAFQEFDQVAVMKPVTKWAERVYETRRIPELIDQAFRQAFSGKPGPVYLDLPSDVLYGQVEESSVTWPDPARAAARPRPAADPAQVRQVVDSLEGAERPVILSGSGVLWSGASDALRELAQRYGVPLYTTPQGRGVIAEDLPEAMPNARSTAMGEADLVLVVGTRLNYVFSRGLPPRIAAGAKMVRIDIDPAEVAASPRVDLGIVGDARTVLQQLLDAAAGRLSAERYAAWRRRLGEVEAARRPKQEQAIATDQVPIHPLRLCKEVRDFIERDAILVVDGQEILNYGRQTIPSYLPGRRLNSGPFGTMGVGLPFGLGAKAARPDAQVVVLHGDGSFGMNGLELDTAVRHRLPVLVVISLNGGWTADPNRDKPGRELGYTRFDEIARALGCHGEFVERPQDIRPALERAWEAVRAGRPAVVNVVTDFAARAVTVKFAQALT